MVSSSEHAARLRILRACLGMIYHEDSDLVFDQDPDAEKAVRNTILAIRSSTPVTEEDCIDYGNAAGQEMVVAFVGGRYKFCWKRDGSAVEFIEGKTSIPVVSKST